MMRRMEPTQEPVYEINQHQDASAAFASARARDGGALQPGGVVVAVHRRPRTCAVTNVRLTLNAETALPEAFRCPACGESLRVTCVGTAHDRLNAAMALATRVHEIMKGRKLDEPVVSDVVILQELAGA